MPDPPIFLPLFLTHLVAITWVLLSLYYMYNFPPFFIFCPYCGYSFMRPLPQPLLLSDFLLIPLIAFTSLDFSDSPPKPLGMIFKRYHCWTAGSKGIVDRWGKGTKLAKWIVIRINIGTAFKIKIQLHNCKWEIQVFLRWLKSLGVGPGCSHEFRV